MFCLFLLGSLSSCTSIVTERAAEDVSSVAIRAGTTCPVADESVDDSITAELCFLNADATSLVRVIRSISLMSGDDEAHAVLMSLLSGPREEDSGAWWPAVTGVQNTTMEISGGIAVVNLPSRFRSLDPAMLYATRLAIAETLCSLPKISYVNVLIGGREEGIDLAATVPAGTLTRSGDNDVSARYSLLEDQRTSGNGFSRIVTFYYPSKDGRFLLPTVRNVDFDTTQSVDYLYRLLQELAKVPHQSQIAENVPAPLDFLQKMPEIERTQDSTNRVVTLHLREELRDALKKANLTEGIWLAMLDDTLTGFIPGIDGISVTIGETPVTGLAASRMPNGNAVTFPQEFMTRNSFQNLIGAGITLYTRNAGENKLTRLESVVPESEANDLRRRMDALMALEGEAAVLPDSLDAEDILACRIERTNLVMNLSEQFGIALRGMNADEVRYAVYAMVNTLTEGRKQQNVIFFFAGRQIGNLAGGLNLQGKMVRNPGMVE